ncbi:MAG: LLM class flavin-dependent oxidoreductase [Rhizomicrobium sp.]
MSSAKSSCPSRSPPDHERRLILDTLEEARAADRAGFEIWWQVEHHGAPEFSYSAAPELILTAIAMTTQRIHVGHAGVLAPFRINGPLRVAERAAMLDILSGGRLELGLAKSGGKEWETFGVDPETARDELREALLMIPKMWTDETFSWDSRLFQMPEREVVPRPLQKPHPRLWQTASSPDSFRMAGELGVGVLGTTLLSPVSFMKAMLDEYERGFGSRHTPAGPLPQPSEGRLHLRPPRGIARSGDRQRRRQGRAVVRARRAHRVQGAALDLVGHDPRRPQSASGAQIGAGDLGAVGRRSDQPRHRAR